MSAAGFGGLSPPRARLFQDLYAPEARKSLVLSSFFAFAFAQRRDFPQFFPQVWKTLVRDQTVMELAEGLRPGEGRRL
jgi:hypothetical protein